VAIWLAENVIFCVQRPFFLYGQRISAACNSVSIEIKVCCEAQQINRIKTIGNVDGAERNRIDRNRRGTVMLIRETGQLISEKNSIKCGLILFTLQTNILEGENKKCLRNFGRRNLKK
jgi:hypothetical protein